MMVAAITLLLAQLPYVLAYFLTPSDLLFSGALGNLHDANSYLAKIRQGMQSGWLFYDLYTPEPHPGALLFLFYIFLGKVAALCSLTPDLALALARPVFGLVLTATLYWFLAILLKRRDDRKKSFLFLCFSSGLGWLLLLFGESELVGYSSPDLWVPEAITFFTLLSFPHFAAATSLTLVTVGALFVSFRTGRHAPAICAAVACFVLSWIHPFNLAVVFGVLATYLVGRMVKRRCILWKQLRQLGLCLALSLPVVLYIQFGVLASNQVLRAWISQSRLASPHPVAYLIGYGLLVPLALAGAAKSIRAGDHAATLPLFWIGAGSILLYLPFDTQRRFLEGMHVPFSLLASLGWNAITIPDNLPRIGVIILKSALISGLVASNVLILTSTISIATSQRYPYFIHDYEAEALVWLGEHNESQDTVLSSCITGSFIPAWAGKRVVIGHYAETIRFEEKASAVLEFFALDTPDEVRRAIVQRFGVAYLFYGPNEQALGDYDPSGDPLWQCAFTNDHITLYRSTINH